MFGRQRKSVCYDRPTFDFDLSGALQGRSQRGGGARGPGPPFLFYLNITLTATSSLSTRSEHFSKFLYKNNHLPQPQSKGKSWLCPTRTLSYFPLVLASFIKQGYGFSIAYSRTMTSECDKALLEMILKLAASFDP